MATFILDLDGTVHRAGTPIPGAVQAIQQLSASGHLITYATNDATMTRADQARWLRGIGLSVTLDQIATAGAAAARVVADRSPPCHGAFVLGPRAVRAELLDALPDLDLEAESPDVVVIGLDEDLSYRKLHRAHQAVERGAWLLATNADARYPVGEGRTAPGAGSIVAAVERSTGVTARVIGKPSPLLFEPLVQWSGSAAEDIIVVGDSPADLEAAAALGARSVLTLTGVVATADGLRADLVVNSIADLPAAVALCSTW